MSNKQYRFDCAPIQGSDQPAHPRSLIRVFDRHSMTSQGSNISTGGTLRALIKLWNNAD